MSGREEGVVLPCPFCGRRPGSNDLYAWCTGTEGERHMLVRQDHATWNTRAEAADGARLREALSALLPAKLCGESWGLPDSEPVAITITFGKMKAARAALTPTASTPAGPATSDGERV